MQSWEGRRKGEQAERQKVGGEKVEGRCEGCSWATVQRQQERKGREMGRKWGHRDKRGEVQVGERGDQRDGERRRHREVKRELLRQRGSKIWRNSEEEPHSERRHRGGKRRGREVEEGMGVQESAVGFPPPPPSPSVRFPLP